MWNVIFWIFILAVCVALLVAAVWYYTTQMGSGSGSPGLFGSRPEKRLAVVEQSNVDGRRKLVLIRRDDVEHLIMTGGPVDVVIETNIADARSGAGGKAGADRESSSEPVFSRSPRSFGKAVGE